MVRVDPHRVLPYNKVWWPSEEMSNRREREVRKTIALLLPLLLVLLVNAPATDAWDAEGHYMVCRIAQVASSVLLTMSSIVDTLLDIVLD